MESDKPLLGPIAQADRLERAIRALAVLEGLLLRDIGEEDSPLYIIAHAGFGLCPHEDWLPVIEKYEAELKEQKVMDCRSLVEKFLFLCRVENCNDPVRYGTHPRHEQDEL